jgi:hypothetical protein
MYLTTSRKPSLTTKRLCRVLARLLPRGTYENRGKKSIEDVVSRAKKLGKSRVLLIYEHKGNPDKMTFMEIGKEWNWLSPEIRIEKLGKLPILNSRTNHIKLDGEMEEKLENLFNLEEPKDDGETILGLGIDSWSFYSGKKKVFSFGVSYGVQGNPGDTV